MIPRGDDDFPPGLSRRARLWMELFTELDVVSREQFALEFVSGDPDRFSGNTTFKTARGWLITIFIDCGGWDYIDDAVTPDGISLRSEATNGAEYLDGAFCGTIYSPNAAEEKQVWGIA